MNIHFSRQVYGRMKAAVFYEYGDIDVLQIADVPKPSISDNEILVKVKAAAVNPKDTFIRKGRFKRFTGNQFPQLVGFDFSGEVAESNHPHYKIGDAVSGMLEGWHGGSAAEYVAVKAHQLAKKPDAVSFEDAAAVPLVALTTLQALRDDARIKPGDKVCINGASGGVGTMAVQIAKIYGAEVTAIASQSNHDFLKTLGADYCIDYRETNITSSNSKFNIFFDVFGNTRFASIKPILTENGTWVSTVIQPHVFVSMGLSYFSSKTAKLVVVKAQTDDFKLIGEWMEARKLKAIIHDTYPLEKIADAHRQQQSKHTRGKLVIHVQ